MITSVILSALWIVNGVYIIDNGNIVTVRWANYIVVISESNHNPTISLPGTQLIKKI